MDEAEVVAALVAKLIEEAEELRRTDPDDRLGELADIREVLAALIQALGLIEDQVGAAAFTKRVLRGGFTGRVWLDEVVSAHKIHPLPSAFPRHGRL